MFKTFLPPFVKPITQPFFLTLEWCENGEEHGETVRGDTTRENYVMLVEAFRSRGIRVKDGQWGERDDD